MSIPRVVPLDPSDARLFQFQRTGPFAEPEEFFCERPHKPFCIDIALGVLVNACAMPRMVHALRKATAVG